MINPKLINPKSIVIIGGSDNLKSPGGKLVDNILNNNFKGKVYVVNPKKDNVRGLPTYKDINQLPDNIDLAIIAISSKYVEATIKILTEEKNTKGFIIISAGFSDAGKEGKEIEERIVKQIEKNKGSLLGPNNIGLINTNFAGSFTTPVPQLDKAGVDMISGSGATAVFIIEAAIKQGLKFNSIWTVGNSAQIGIEDVLEHMDNTFNNESPKIKLLYIESILNPKKFLKHSSSLIRKGCKIVAIKAGNSSAGNRAASSHTGALATPDIAIQTLFDKAGIIRAYGRNEMIQIAGILFYGVPKNNRVLIVTHAGGPGVMLADILEKNGMQIPLLNNNETKKIKEQLYPGSSVENPIDFLATGTAEQLNIILKYAKKMHEIDSIIVIFGSPGLFPVFEVYEVLAKHIKSTTKPIYPILPSLVNVEEEIKYFHNKSLMSFPYEVLMGKALAKTYYAIKNNNYKTITKNKISGKIKIDKKEGYISPKTINKLLKSFNLPTVTENTFTNIDKALLFARKLYPVVMKVVGPVHKSDIGGVKLNIDNDKDFISNFNELMKIKNVVAIMIQEQKIGMELFVGAKYESKFGHIIMFGLGGIFIEVLKDFQSILSPVSKEEITDKIKKLKAYPLLEGVRGKKGINLDKFIDLIINLDNLLQTYPEIKELDFNPVIASEKDLFIVDSRIFIS